MMIPYNALNKLVRLEDERRQLIKSNAEEVLRKHSDLSEQTINILIYGRDNEKKRKRRRKLILSVSLFIMLLIAYSATYILSSDLINNPFYVGISVVLVIAFIVMLCIVINYSMY